MRIDIITVRDPDGYDDPAIYIDGKPLHECEDIEVHHWGVDAGAGYPLYDWADSARSDKRAAPARVWDGWLAEAYRNPPGYKYIDNWPFDEDDKYRDWFDHLDDSDEEWNRYWAS